jgi:hypothetical protein
MRCCGSKHSKEKANFEKKKEEQQVKREEKDIFS